MSLCLKGKRNEFIQRANGSVCCVEVVRGYYLELVLGSLSLSDFVCGSDCSVSVVSIR